MERTFIMLEKLFKLSKNGTNVKTEVVAGITTFMTMAYILAVNPSILADAGMDPIGSAGDGCFAVQDQCQHTDDRENEGHSISFHRQSPHWIV
jgi:hypothetical protein